MVEIEYVLCPKQDWITSLTIYVANESTVYDWGLQQSIITFLLTNRIAIRIYKGANGPQLRL